MDVPTCASWNAAGTPTGAGTPRETPFLPLKPALPSGPRVRERPHPAWKAASHRPQGWPKGQACLPLASLGKRKRTEAAQTRGTLKSPPSPRGDLPTRPSGHGESPGPPTARPASSLGAGRAEAGTAPPTQGPSGRAGGAPGNSPHTRRNQKPPREAAGPVPASPTSRLGGQAPGPRGRGEARARDSRARSLSSRYRPGTPSAQPYLGPGNRLQVRGSPEDLSRGQANPRPEKEPLGNHGTAGHTGGRHLG